MFSSEFLIRFAVEPEYKYARIAAVLLVIAYGSYKVGQKSVSTAPVPYTKTCRPSLDALGVANKGLRECISGRADAISVAVEQCVETERRECAKQLIEQSAGVPSLNCEICVALGYIDPLNASKEGAR